MQAARTSSRRARTGIQPSPTSIAEPDVVFLSTEPFPFKPAHADELAAASAIARDRFEIVDGELLSWHGSRTPAGIDYAEQVIDRVRTSGRP